MSVNTYAGNRFVRIEVIFFVSYFLVFPFLSDLEFNLREPGGNVLAVFTSLPYRIISGILHMLPYVIFYKLLLHRYLFQRRLITFFLSLLVFLVFFNSYTPLVDWLIAAFNFRASNFNSAQGIDFGKAIRVNFSVMYLIRELLVITALGYFIRSARQEIQLGQMQQQQLSTELNYLKVQLQPHFFFNTLNNIYSLVLQKSEKAAPLVARHADMMRYILYDAGDHSVSLQQEIEFLRNYVEVETVRYSNRFDIFFEVQGISSDARIEPLLLLPFIENTFKHGIREDMEEGFVHIILSLVDHELSAEIRNSKPQTLPGGTVGIGIENARKRLEMLYPDRYKLEINEDDQQYEVFLTITLKPW